jgi:hypothetical protein
MGRPIKKKFFGNLNVPNHGSVSQGSGVGGEAVASLSFSNTGTARYSTGTTITLGAPNIAGGVRATATPTFNASGQFTGAVVTNGGSGYTTATTVTITTATGVASTVNSGTTATYAITVSDASGIKLGMLIYGGSTGVAGRVVNVTGNVVTSNTLNNGTWSNAANLKFYDTGAGGAATGVLAVGQRQDAITFSSWIPGAGQARLGGDIIKQESSHRYLVKNSDGVGQCKLVASDSPAEGEMYIIATDANGSTYWVTKLTAHKARVKRRTMSTAYLIADGAQTGWNIGVPSGTIVTLSNTN